MNRTSPGRRGFTLIELMITVAIIAVLSLIAIPRFADLITRAKEAGSLGHLGHIRSGILLYFMENDQNYPPDFAALIQPDRRYIRDDAIPLYTGDHDDSTQVNDIPDLDPSTDNGDWSYVQGGTDKGHFYIQCIHTDSKGRVWSSH